MSGTSECRVPRRPANAAADGQVLEALPCGVLVLDAEGRVTRANPAARALIGDDPCGRAWRDIVSERLVVADAGGEAAIRTLDGRVLCVDVGTPAAASGQVVVVSDVTEAHRTQRRLRDLQRVYDTGSLLGTLAHQLRTPLATALLDADNLRLQVGANGGRAVAIAGRLVDRLRDMDGLLDEMLRFTRGAPLGVAPLDLDGLVAGLADDLGAQAAARGACLHLVAPGGAGRVLGSARALASAVENLVVNAFDAGGPGVAVTVTAGARAGVGVITVSDDGPGVSPGDEARIFEPLYTTRERGNGLGLAVSRAMLEAHRGSLALVPSERGAAFEACIPLAPVESHREPAR